MMIEYVHLPLFSVLSPLIKVALRSKYYDDMLEIMLHLPLVGRNVVGKRIGKGIKSRDDDDTQILRVLLLKD